jgi:cytochrome P450
MPYRLTDPAFLDDPTDTLAQMRAEGPLVQVRVPMLGNIWMTTTDAATRALLKAPDVFVRDPTPITGRSLAQRFWWMPRSVKPLFNTIIAKDDPEHKRLRALVDQAFARTAIEELAPRVEALADRLLDALPNGTRVDIVAHYTRALPFLTICTLLGVPQEMHSRLLARIAPLSHATSPLRAIYAFARLRAVQNDFKVLFAKARRAPGPGLISALVHAEHDGATLSEEELLSTVMLLFLAGHETTVHLINNAIVALADDPALRAHWAAQPDRRPLMIEEFLRFYAPVMMTKPMFVAQDNNLLGPSLSKGETVAAFLLAANHDPARVEDAATLQPERRPNAHVGFGFGPHVCLGMQLARMEAVVALDRLFSRYPTLSLTERTRWLKRPGIRAPAGLLLDMSAT